MLRKTLNTSLFAAVVMIASSAIVQADCGLCGSAVCGGGCASAGLGCGPGGCNGGNCFSSLFGHQDNAGGPCMTCENIWDDYCAEKQRCLPQPKYPFQNKSSLCGGGCNSGCAPCAGGVGIYGSCGNGGGCGLLGKLFKHHKAPAACESGDCASGGCADGGCAAPAMSAPVPAYSSPAPVSASPVYNQAPMSQPYPTSYPVEAHSAPAAPSVGPVDVPVPAPADTLNTPTPVPPKPKALPSVTDQTQKTGTFNWLQRALNVN